MPSRPTETSRAGTVVRVAQRAGKPSLAAGAAVAGIASAVVATRALRPKRSNGLHLNVAKLNTPSRNEIAKGLTITGRHVGHAAERLSKLASDIQQAGETAERVGKVLSK